MTERSEGLVHRAMVYDDDQVFLDTAVTFLREGLEAGDAVLAVGSASGADGLRAALGARAEAVEFRDAAHWYAQPTRAIAAYSAFIAGHAGARIRVVAEPGWTCRTPVEIAEWTRYESIVNEAFAATEASVLCVYDRRTSVDGVVDGALRTHPELVGDGGPRPNLSYRDPPAVYAEVDRQELPPAPAHALATPVDDIDLRSLRAFVAGYAEDHGIASARCHDLLVATTEVASNAVRHGLPPVTCRVWAEDGHLVVEVADTGHWRTGTAPGFLPPDPLERRGFGLWGVRMLCPLVQIRPGPAGTVVRLRVPLR